MAQQQLQTRQSVDNCGQLQETFSSEQEALLPQEIVNSDQRHQLAMAELIRRHSEELRDVRRETRHVFAAEKKSLEESVKSKNSALAQEKEQTSQEKARTSAER